MQCVNDFLNFNKMLTPTIIKVIFLVGSALSVLGGLFTIIGGASQPFGGGLTVFMGFIIMIFGPFLTRIYCELLIVQFKMHEALEKISNKSTSE
jgi:hypothetical protein